MDAAARNSAYRQLALHLDPDKHPDAPLMFKARVDMAFGKLNDAKGADDLSGGVPHKTRTESQRYSEAKRREAERKRQEKAAATRKEAEEASARATAFQRAVMSMIKAPARASAGITPWKHPYTGLPINVDFAKVDACKVPPFR